MTAFGTRSDEQTFSRAQAGDRAALNRFLLDNELLVKKVVFRYRCEPSMVDDLVQEGSIGMLKALEKFDTSRGFKFSTYAMPWIRVYVDRYLQANVSILSMPMRTRELSFKVSAMCQHMGKSQVADKLGISTETVEAMDLIRKVDPDAYDIPSSFDVDQSLSFERLVDSLNAVLGDMDEQHREIALLVMDVHPEYESIAQYLKSVRLTRNQLTQLSRKVVGRLQVACQHAH